MRFVSAVRPFFLYLRPREGNLKPTFDWSSTLGALDEVSCAQVGLMVTAAMAVYMLAAHALVLLFLC